MAKLSDIIEQFLLKTLGEETEVDISRNELATFFSCAPSQINYVLQTRFTIDRGYAIESQRGGGGFIKISRVPLSSSADTDIIESVGEQLSQKRMSHMLDNLSKEGILTKPEKKLVEIVLSDSALQMPVNIRDNVRAQSFKNLLIFLLRGRTNE